MTQRTDQPTDVSTQEAPRPRDSDVVTSDLQQQGEPGDGSQTPPAAAAGEPSPKASESAPGETNKQEPPKRNRAAERRIKKLTAGLAEKDAEIAELRERLDRLESAQTQARPKPPKPKIVDFDGPEEYAEAYAKWKAETAEAPKPRQNAPRTPQRAAEGQPPRDPELDAFRKRGTEKLGDEFLEALQDPNTAVNQVMGDFLLESDVGPEIYVHLANNPEQARKIYDYSAPRAIKAMETLAEQATKGELDVGDGEIKVEPTPGEKTPSKPKPTPAAPAATKAPPPPSDAGAPGEAQTPINPEAESMDDYAARRRKEIQEGRGLT